MSTKFPRLYHKSRSGKIHSWKIWTEGADVCTEYGQLDGKKQTARKTSIGKNIGKTNETTPAEQAERDAASMFTFKLDRKYSETVSESKETIFLPMLAHDFEKKKKKVKYPVDMQPKLDGLRCLAFYDHDEKKVFLMSRSGKSYSVPHLEKQIERLLKDNTDLVLDGELYIHGETFQTITRLVKKHRDESVNLEFHIYDVADVEDPEAVEPETWKDRLRNLKDLFKDCPKKYRKHLKKHKTIINVKSEKDIYAKQAQWVSEGYEGAIVRTHDHLYNWGYRSPGLLKVKNFHDAEFKVVGYTVGVGKAKETVTWECEAESGQIFRCYSKGSMEERKELKDNADSYVGQWLKVKFFERTDDGIPRFPIGIGFRLDKDM